MIEKTVLDFLNARMPVPVLAEISPNPPEIFVLIEKTGSGRSNHIQSATLLVILLSKLFPPTTVEAVFVRGLTP